MSTANECPPSPISEAREIESDMIQIQSAINQLQFKLHEIQSGAVHQYEEKIETIKAQLKKELDDNTKSEANQIAAINTKFNNRISGVEEDDLIEEEDKAAIIKAYESSRQDAIRKKSNEFTTLRNEINTRYKEEIDKINNSIAVARQLGEKNEGLSCPPSPLSEMRQIHDRLAKLQLEECASCGKEGNSGDMNTCNKCKMVKYCNAACKKKHRKKHKKDCKLFKEPPPNEECPICFLPFQYIDKTETFKTCCGKRICNGCIHAIWMSEGKDLYPFCRTQPPTSGQEEIKRLKKLMDKGNARAFFACGNHYHFGNTYLGLPQDHQKANELYLKAGELGCAAAYSNLGLIWSGKGYQES